MTRQNLYFTNGKILNERFCSSPKIGCDAVLMMKQPNGHDMQISGRLHSVFVAQLLIYKETSRDVDRTMTTYVCVECGVHKSSLACSFLRGHIILPTK